MTRWRKGDRVRFAHQHPEGPVHTISAVVREYLQGRPFQLGEPMVELEDMAGQFATHIFVAADSNHDAVRDAAAGER